MLLKQPNAKVNQPDQFGHTPLFIACQNGFKVIVELILQCRNNERVDVNKANHNGFTPVFMACQAGQLDVVKILLQTLLFVSYIFFIIILIGAF